MRRSVLIGTAVALVAGCSSQTTTGPSGAGRIDGWVCLGPHGTPSAGARVSVMTAGGETLSTEATSDGSFALDAVAAGEATVVFTNRIEQRVEKITVTDGQSVAVGTACAWVGGVVQVNLCVDGSPTAESGTAVSLDYLDAGGAQVSRLTGATDASGGATFMNLVPGEYRLTVGSITDPEVLVVAPGTTATFDDPGCYDPATVGTVTGRICNPIDGDPVADVDVELDVAGDIRDTTTDVEGRFRFDAVPPGMHLLTIRPPLQQPTELNVQVIAGQTTTLPSACTMEDTGNVDGIICDPGSGMPAAGISVQLDVSGGPARFASTNAGGYFRFDAVPPGMHTLTVPLPPGTPRVETVTVVAAEDTTVPSPQCNAASFGSVSGRVCNPADEMPVGGVPVDLDVAGEPSPRTTTTASDGRFMFDLVPPGMHTVTVRPPLQAPVQASVTVTAGMETQIPAPTCGSGPIPNPATLTGIACVGITSQHPLPGATVSVDFNPGLKTTIAGTDGSFTISNLAAGPVEITISRGSWSTTFNDTLVADTTLDIGMTRCVGAGTRAAVITGPYDDLTAAFTDLGLPVRQNEMGTIVNAAGVLDLVDGSSDTWITTWAASLSNLQAYDMIFFTSGLNISLLADTNGCGLPPSNDPMCATLPGVIALENIEAYLDGGGAALVSDWAYEIVRRQFPQYINFYSNDFIQLKALCGHAPHAAAGLVLDENLALVLGTANVTVDYAAGFEFWAVISPMPSQPNGYLVPFLVADVPVYEYTQPTDDFCNSGMITTQAQTPLLVATPVGSNGGRLIFTTFRYQAPAMTANAEVLRQILLEL